MLAERIWIIELNPFAETTGACLFDWAADAQTLRSAPVEMRVVREPRQHLDVLLMPWKDILTEALDTDEKPSIDSTSGDAVFQPPRAKQACLLM